MYRFTKSSNPGYQLWDNYPPSPISATGYNYGRQAIVSYSGDIWCVMSRESDATNVQMLSTRTFDSNKIGSVNPSALTWAGARMYKLVGGAWSIWYSSEYMPYTAILEANHDIYVDGDTETIAFGRTTTDDQNNGGEITKTRIRTMVKI